MITLPEILEKNFDVYEIEYRIHSSRRMFQRGINSEDVELILKEGEVIERYSDDYPLPSLLLNGKTVDNNPLHTVVAVNQAEMKVVIITVYEPILTKWADNYTRRL